MTIFLNNVLFSYYPYVAITVFFVGSILRYEKDQYGWKSGSSQILRKDLLFWGSNLFHFGVIFILFGHFFGLMTPEFVYRIFLKPEQKQILAMVSGGIAGVFCFIGMTILVYRRLSDSRVRVTSSVSDIFILFFLYIQLILGLMSIYISYQHINDASIMIALASWVQGIVTFNPDVASYVLNVHWIFKVHLFLGMTMFLVFPFTRLVHVFSFPYLYFFRTGYQLVRKLK
ncbi:MAG TPA: respiratory nitrate reductase subunit gamma [Candidatus Azoamicus sp. OHIO1]